MTHNKSGALTRRNKEWGSKLRKSDDDLRGLNNRGRRESIADQLDQLFPKGVLRDLEILRHEERMEELR